MAFQEKQAQGNGRLKKIFGTIALALAGASLLASVALLFRGNTKQVVRHSEMDVLWSLVAPKLDGLRKSDEGKLLAALAERAHKLTSCEIPAGTPTYTCRDSELRKKAIQLASESLVSYELTKGALVSDGAFPSVFQDSTGLLKFVEEGFAPAVAILAFAEMDYAADEDAKIATNADRILAQTNRFSKVSAQEIAKKDLIINAGTRLMSLESTRPELIPHTVHLFVRTHPGIFEGSVNKQTWHIVSSLALRHLQNSDSDAKWKANFVRYITSPNAKQLDKYSHSSPSNQTAGLLLLLKTYRAYSSLKSSI